MKKIMGSICLALFCLGVIGVECEMALHFGSMVVLFASVAFLGVISVTLLRAPEGYQWFDGFHICPRDRRSRRVSGIRLSRRERAARGDAARFSRPLLAFRLFPQWLTRGVSTAD